MADSSAHLLSYADGKPLKEVVQSGNDAEATGIICGVLRQLHSTSECTATGLKTLSENFRSLFNYAADNRANPIFSAAANCASNLLSTEKEKVVLHGDIHHKNIILSSEDGWLAIDPKGLFGERTYDFANVFFNPDDMPELVEHPERIVQIANLFSEYFKVDQSRILRFAFSFGCLSARWAMEDGLNPERRLRIARMIQKLI